MNGNLPETGVNGYERSDSHNFLDSNRPDNKPSETMVLSRDSRLTLRGPGLCVSRRRPTLIFCAMFKDCASVDVTYGLTGNHFKVFQHFVRLPFISAIDLMDLALGGDDCGP